MNAQTLKALEESIAHWEEMRDDINASTPGAENCAVCIMFAVSCNGCPVADIGGAPNCEGSPYYEAREAFWYARRFPADELMQAEWKQEAQKEIDFLKSLLPPDGHNEEPGVSSFSYD